MSLRFPSHPPGHSPYSPSNGTNKYLKNSASDPGAAACRKAWRRHCPRRNCTRFSASRRFFRCGVHIRRQCRGPSIGTEGRPRCCSQPPGILPLQPRRYAVRNCTRHPSLRSGGPCRERRSRSPRQCPAPRPSRSRKSLRICRMRLRQCRPCATSGSGRRSCRGGSCCA